MLTLSWIRPIIEYNSGIMLKTFDNITSPMQSRQTKNLPGYIIAENLVVLYTGLLGVIRIELTSLLLKRYQR